MTHVALARTYEKPVGSPTPERAFVHALFRGFGRHPVVLLGMLVLVTAVPLTGQTRLHSEPSGAPADLFMQSVATLDGDLGWRQLCPAVQAQLPRAVILEQTGAQRLAASERGVSLSIDHVGDRGRPDGGKLHFYVATAHGADGAVSQKTYIVETQPGGCVESVA